MSNAFKQTRIAWCSYVRWGRCGARSHTSRVRPSELWHAHDRAPHGWATAITYMHCQKPARWVVTCLYTCIPVYLYTCISVYTYTCIPVYPYTRTPVYLYTCIPVYLYTCIPAYQHTSTCIPVHQYTSIPVHRYTCIPAYLYTSIPVYLHNVRTPVYITITLCH